MPNHFTMVRKVRFINGTPIWQGLCHECGFATSEYKGGSGDRFAEIEAREHQAAFA